MANRTAARLAPRTRRHHGVPASVRETLRRPGERLDHATRAAMESRFRFDFGHIRVHRDALAAEAAREVDASAFTAGRHVVLGAGPVAPFTLAHELAHSSRTEHDPDRLTLGGMHDAEEASAERAAHLALSPVAAGAPPPADATPPVIRRRAAGAALGAIGGGLAGAAVGALIGSIFGPLGAAIGAGIGLVVGAVAGGIIGHFATEPPAPMHLETIRPTDLRTDPSGPTTMVVARLQAGTHLAPADVAQGAPTLPNWLYVRVLSGPNNGSVGWVRREDVVSRGLTETFTVQEAQSLYSELAAGTFTRANGTQEGIPFHYPLEYCFARAQRMVEILNEKGYAAQKVFAASRLPSGQNALRAPSPHGADPILPGETGPGATWWYHVAPIVNVRQPDGSIQRWVIDPSTQPQAVTVETWINNINRSGVQLAEIPFSTFRETAGTDRAWTGSVFTVAPPSAYTPERDVSNPPEHLGTTEALEAGASPYNQGASRLAAALRGLLAANAPEAQVISTIGAAHPESRQRIRERYEFHLLRSQLASRYSAAVTAALASTAPATGGP